jgi:hypothetical protein
VCFAIFGRFLGFGGKRFSRDNASNDGNWEIFVKVEKLAKKWQMVQNSQPLSPRAGRDTSRVQANDGSVVGEQLIQHTSEKTLREDYVVIDGKNWIRVRKISRQGVPVHHVVAVDADELHTRGNRRRVCLKIVPDKHHVIDRVSHNGVPLEELQVIIPSSGFISHQHYRHLVILSKRCFRRDKLATLLRQTLGEPWLGKIVMPPKGSRSENNVFNVIVWYVRQKRSTAADNKTKTNTLPFRLVYIIRLAGETRVISWRSLPRHKQCF